MNGRKYLIYKFTSKARAQKYLLENGYDMDEIEIKKIEVIE